MCFAFLRNVALFKHLSSQPKLVQQRFASETLRNVTSEGNISHCFEMEGDETRFI